MQLRPTVEIIPGVKTNRLIGRGVFGEVWECASHGGTTVALKVVELPTHTPFEVIESVRRVARIQHANLASVFAVSIVDAEGRDIIDAEGRSISEPHTDPRYALLVTQWGECDAAKHLEDCRSEGGQGIPTDELLQIIDDVARAADYLHRPVHDLGGGPVAVPHGLIKPRNIMLQGGSAFLTDAGLAHALRPKPSRIVHAGSLGYLAPECIEGKPASAASDQYSLAITYCHLLTGQLPFSEQDSFADVIEAPLRGQLDLSGLPPAEADVIRRATSRDPGQRFGSCREMVVQLYRAAPEVEARPVPRAAAPPAIVQPPEPSPPPVPVAIPSLPEAQPPYAESVIPEEAAITPAKPHHETSSVERFFHALTLLIILALCVYAATEFILDHPFDWPDQPSPPVATADSEAANFVEAADQLRRTMIADEALMIAGRGAATDAPAQLVAVLGSGSNKQLAQIACAAYSPDGKHVASACESNQVTIWEMASGTEARRLEGHQDTVYRIAYSPDSQTLATASVDKTIKLWDLASGTTIHTLAGHTQRATCVAFHPKGTQVVSSGHDGTARIWSVETGKLLQVLKGHTDTVYTARFNHDGTRIVTASFDETAKVWDTASGEVVATLAGHQGWLRDAVFGPEGKTVATAGVDKKVILWKIAGADMRHVLEGHEGWVRSVIFSPDGTHLVSSGYDGTARFWEISTGTLTAKLDLNPPGKQVAEVHFSPSGRYLGTANGNGTIYILRMDGQ